MEQEHWGHLQACGYRLQFQGSPTKRQGCWTHGCSLYESEIDYTQVRDRAFALLGLTHDGRALVPMPNYVQVRHILLRCFDGAELWKHSIGACPEPPALETCFWSSAP